MGFALGIAVSTNDFTATVTGFEPDPGDPLRADFTFRIVHYLGYCEFLDTSS